MAFGFMSKHKNNLQISSGVKAGLLDHLQTIEVGIVYVKMLKRVNIKQFSQNQKCK